MGESIWESLGVYTLKKKVGITMGCVVLLLLLVLGYYYYTMPKQPEPMKPVTKNVSGSPLGILLTDYAISIFEPGNTTGIYLPSAWNISNDLDWIMLNTACGKTDTFDLRKYENSWANLTVYRTDGTDIENGKPILLHVIIVNKSIACAYKTTEGRPEEMYGLSQVLGAWAK